jgi:hypothetical protein
MKKLLINLWLITIIIAASCVEKTKSDYKIKAKLPFKTFLKNKKIPVDIDQPNEFETIQPGNKYTNHYFGVTTAFPKDWKHDRGSSIFTLIRAFDEQKSSTLTLLAIPIEIGDSTKAKEHQKIYRESPLKAMNSTAKGDFSKKLFDEITLSTNSKISNFKINEEWVSTTHYLTYEYEFEEKYEGTTFAFKAVGYQVILWGINYSFGYIAPVKYFNNNLLRQTLLNTNYIRVK